jgi:hypothetical protein
MKLTRIVSFSAFIFLSATNFAWAEKVKLDEGTSIDLQLQSSVSSESATEGESVKLTVLFDVFASDGKTVLIKAGTAAKGFVSTATNSEKMGEAGVIGVMARSTKAIDGTSVPLMGSIKRSGKDKSSAMIWWGYWGMAQKGGEAVLSPGMILKASTDQDVSIETSSVDP